MLTRKQIDQVARFESQYGLNQRQGLTGSCAPPVCPLVSANTKTAGEKKSTRVSIELGVHPDTGERRLIRK